MRVIPISALQHYVYCPRQCALIHLEATYEENLYTMEGATIHRNVHSESRNGDDAETALPVWSDTLGLSGVVDVVEFCDSVPYPVEFKRAKLKDELADRVQLCAQALCLEEMFGHPVTEGAVFYHGSRRRRVVALDEELRLTTKATVEAVRRLLEREVVPEPVADWRCTNCSINGSCLPWYVKSTQQRGHQTGRERD